MKEWFLQNKIKNSCWTQVFSFQSYFCSNQKEDKKSDICTTVHVAKQLFGRIQFDISEQTFVSILFAQMSF